MMMIGRGGAGGAAAARANPGLQLQTLSPFRALVGTWQKSGWIRGTQTQVRKQSPLVIHPRWKGTVADVESTFLACCVAFVLAAVDENETPDLKLHR